MVQALFGERRLRSAVTVVALAVLASTSAGQALGGGKPGGTPTSIGAISVLSNRADLISGGDALVADRPRRRGRRVGEGDAERRGRDRCVRRPRERPLRGARDRAPGRPERARRATGGRLRPAGRDPQPPDRRPRLLRAAGDAVLLQPERVEPAARHRDRRAVQRADEGRAPLPEHGHAAPVRPVRPGEPAAGRIDRADDHGRGQDGPVHRAARHRHCEPRHLPDRGARRPDKADRAVVDEPAVEQEALPPVRRRVREPARSDRARQRAAGGAARARLRGRHVEPQHLREQLQRPDLRRGDDDDEGDRRRALRAAALHDGERRLGGVDAAAPPRRELPWPPRRLEHEPGLSRPPDAGPRLARLPAPVTTTSGRPAPSSIPGTPPRRRTRSSRPPPRGCRSGGATPRTRTTSAARRSSPSAPTAPSCCRPPASAAACPPR